MIPMGPFWLRIFYDFMIKETVHCLPFNSLPILLTLKFSGFELEAELSEVPWNLDYTILILTFYMLKKKIKYALFMIVIFCSSLQTEKKPSLDV